jgi:hypothetical protein
MKEHADHSLMEIEVAPTNSLRQCLYHISEIMLQFQCESISSLFTLCQERTEMARWIALNGRQ